MGLQERRRELMKIFSEQISKIRVDRDDDSQESFCEKHHIAPKTLKNWESQKTLPSWEAAVYLADLLNVSLDYFADRHMQEDPIFFNLREIGLSEKAIKVIEDEKNKEDVNRLSEILEQPNFRKIIRAMHLLIR